MKYYGIEITPEEALFIIRLKYEIMKICRENVLDTTRRFMKMKVNKRELELIHAIVAEEKSEFSQLIKSIILLD